MLNHFMSEFLVTVSFTVLLSYLARVSYLKFKESSSNTDLASSLKEIILPNADQDRIFHEHMHPALVEIIEQERQPIQKEKFRYALYVLAYTVAILLLRGGRSYSSWIGISPCGVGFWIMNLLHVALSYLFAKSHAIVQFKLQEEKVKLGYKIDSSQEITAPKMRSNVVYGFVAGLAGGALGLGGAIILVPVWLQVGIDKTVATSSSGPLIFLSSFSSFFISALSGNYLLSQVVYYFILAFISSYIIKSNPFLLNRLQIHIFCYFLYLILEFVTYIADRYNLRSIVYLLLLITMLSSLLVLFPFEISKYFKNPEDFMRFGEFC